MAVIADARSPAIFSENIEIL